MTDPQQSTLAAKYRHSWYQSPEFIIISIFVKNIPNREAVDLELTERSASVTIRLDPPVVIHLSWDPLTHTIDPTACEFTLLRSQVEVRLKKTMVGLQWTALEGEATTDAVMMSSAAPIPSYPTSSQKRNVNDVSDLQQYRQPQKANWDAVAKAAETEANESDALNKLFQTIYKDASEETRRAMVKSFTESNGTCLSTNWEEVGKGRVPISPPDGMVAKPFEQ